MSGAVVPPSDPIMPDIVVPGPSPGDCTSVDTGAVDIGAVDIGRAQIQVLTRTLTICNRRGLHARAAAKFVTMAERFCAAVDVLKDGQSVSARSIMGLMMLGAGRGSPIQLRAEGWDAKEALEALSGLVEAGFDESE